MKLDGVSLVGFSVLPAVVTVDVITWVVSVGPSTVQMYVHQIFFHITCYIFKLKLDPMYVLMLMEFTKNFTVHTVCLI